MEQYTVTGMSCAACTAWVEKAVSGVKGVTSCSVSLLTNYMGVEGTAGAEEIIAEEFSFYRVIFLSLLILCFMINTYAYELLRTSSYALPKAFRSVLSYEPQR